MASGSDIRAGKAFVELYVKNSALMKGLADAQKRLRDFGNGIALVGKWMMGLGAAALVPMAAMVGRFESVGSALNDMSQRTGMSVEALSELKYAAKQTGTDAEAVELGVRKMQKAIADAAAGGEAGAKALSHLGLTIDELRGLSPDKQFELIASRLNAIKNPTQQAAAAMEVFGKTGTKLLPMIADMDVLRARARELGLVMSQEDAAAADAFGDALGDLKKTILGAGNGIMASLAPSLTQFVRAATNAVLQVKQWATENSGLIITVLKVAAGVAAAGAGLFVFGKAIVGVGAILGGLHGFIMWAVGGVQLLVGVLGMAISPALAIGVAITAAGAALLYLARNTAPVQAVGNAIAGFADGIRAMISTVVGDVMTAWGGIADALAAGDISAAVKVVTSTISLEWTRVTTWLQETWQGFLSIWSGITNKIASFMLDAVAAIKSAWAGAMTSMANMWDEWSATLYRSPIYRAITTKAVGLVMGDDFAKQMDQVMQDEAKATPQRVANRNAGLVTERAKIETDRQGQQKNLAEDKRAADEARAAQIAAKQKELDDAIKGRDAAVAAAKESRRKAEAGQLGGGTKPLFEPTPIDIDGLKAAKSHVAGTFSASAVGGLGVGSVQERIAKATEKMFKIAGEQTTVLRNIDGRLQNLDLKAAT